MGIFRDITKSLKKAAPIIGAGIGMYFGGPMGASIGSGIGSLASGRSTEEALRNAALAGASTYAMGGSGFGKKVAGQDYFSGETFDFGKSPLAGVFGGGSDVAPTAIKSADTGGIGSFLGKAALFGGAGALLGGGLGEEKEDKNQNNLMRAYPVGRTRLGTGRIGDKLYNLDDEGEREQYFEDNRNRNTQNTMFAAIGGEVEGPGTGTSDSVPARLSDGEFVVTAKAVRGAGGGDRNVGAARMYDMMSQLEGAA